MTTQSEICATPSGRVLKCEQEAASREIWRHRNYHRLGLVKVPMLSTDFMFVPSPWGASYHFERYRRLKAHRAWGSTEPVTLIDHKLTAYVVWDVGRYVWPDEDGLGIPVFASTSREARTYGAMALQLEDMLENWVDVRCRRLARQDLWADILRRWRTEWPEHYFGEAVTVEEWKSCDVASCRIDWGQDMNGEYYVAGYNLCERCAALRDDLLRTQARKFSRRRA